MTLEILVSSALMGYTMEEQTKILKAIESGANLQGKRLNEGLDKVVEIFDSWEPIIEGYAGFPIEREAIQKKKRQTPDDRNIGRVVQAGGTSYVVTGRKSDGRYIVVGKGGEKTAKDPADMGLQVKEHVDIEDLHQAMLEKKMDGVDDNGFSSCWKGYKKRGTKMKGGKEVNNCVKAGYEAEGEEINEVSADLMLRASKAADVKRGKLAVAGDKEGAAGKAAQAKRFYNAQAKKRLNSSYEPEGHQVDEIYKGKHGQSEKEYQDSRSDGGKMVSGDSKRSGAAYSYRGVKNSGPNPAGGSQKPQGQGRMTSGARTDLQYRKANFAKQSADKKAALLNNEFINKLSASGIFTEAEIERIMEDME